MIKMGDKVKDDMTGFTGVTTARCEYADGCVQWQVEKLVSNDIVSKWIDEERLDSKTKVETGGGLRSHPSR